MESLRDRNQTQGTTKNIVGAFLQEHTHPLIETSSRGSYNSQEFDLDNHLYLRSLSLHKTFLGTLETPTLNTCQTLEVSNKFV